MIVSKLSNALIYVTFFAQLSVMMRYMIKTEQYQLEVTIANVAIESLLLASELYLCYRQYSFVLDPEGWAI